MFFATAVLMAAALPNAVVVQPVANMYSRPTEDTDVVSQAILGSNVAILEAQDGALRIRTADDYTGWVLAPTVRRGKPYAVEGRAVEVASLFAHVYREPNVTRHRPLITAPYETRLEVARDVDERWLAVTLPDGRPGFVQRGDVDSSPPRLSIDEMLAFSRRFLGLPYTWGGTSSYGYDCSGFAQMLMRRRGVLMPRDAQPQAAWDGLKPVARADLQPGDLLYFGQSENKITHTGVYIGGGKFINATTYQAPMVRIDDLNEPRWTRILVASRRLK